MRRIVHPFNHNHQSPRALRRESVPPRHFHKKVRQSWGKSLLSLIFVAVVIYLISQRVMRRVRKHAIYTEKNKTRGVTANPTLQRDNREKQQSNCDKYQGILHIQQGDREGAAGSIFFLFVMNQLFYADKYQLLPWIHLNAISQYVYDDKVHGRGCCCGGFINSNATADSKSCQVQAWTGAQVSWSEYFDHQVNKTFPYPGPPQQLQRSHLQLRNITITGNGVWESYFQQPLYQQFPMPLVNCPHLPVLSMTFDQVIPALHAFCPWSVRAWPYGGLPPSLQPRKNQTTLQWLEPQRIRAHAMVAKYYHFQPTILQRVKDVWLNATASTVPTRSQSNKKHLCLGMHVRHSDKANLRKRIPTDRFIPYVKAYRNAGGNCVYLATDSHKVVTRVKNSWPSALSQMIATPSSVIRSYNKTAVFVLGQNDHHRTNTEVLVDIIALSKCEFLLHGYSAVSEASIYLNLKLHNQSVNLDDRNRPSASEFENIVRQVLQKRANEAVIL